MSFKKHTVKSYDKDLSSITATIDEMKDLVIESIDMVSKMLQSKQQSILDGIKKHDYKINCLDNLIEKKITSILALRQPMAIDLRYIISSLKVSANLERIGDQAKNIIKKINDVGEDEFKVDVENSLQKMIEICKEMVRNSVFSFNAQNIEIADSVLQKDDEVDNLYRDLFKLVDEDEFSRNQVKKITNTLLIAKSFERLADHSTNIAEISKFVVTGEIGD